MDEAEAARSLEMMRTTHRALAARTRWSPARHTVVGIVVGGLIAGYALPDRWPIAVALTCIAATALIVARDRRRDGFFVNGYRAGTTRWITLALVAVTLVALAGALALKTRYGLSWAPVPIGGVAGVAAMIGSMAWERAYRRELDGTGRER